MKVNYGPFAVAVAGDGVTAWCSCAFSQRESDRREDSADGTSADDDGSRFSPFSHPHRLTELTAGLSDSQLGHPPEPGEWSVTEVLAHLRSCADVWGDAIEAIVTTEHPTIRAVNPTTWIKTTDYREIGFGPSLQAFTRQREGLLTLLGRLPNDGWSRSATGAGGGQSYSSSPCALTWTDWPVHERSHWRQVAKTVKVLSG